MKPKHFPILLLVLLLWVIPSGHAEEIARLEVDDGIWLVVESLSRETQQLEGNSLNLLTISMHYELAGDEPFDFDLWVQGTSAKAQRQRFAETGLPKSLLVRSLKKVASTYGIGERNGMLRTTLSVTVALSEPLPDSLFLISCDEYNQPTDHFVLPLTNLSLPSDV